MTDQEKEEILKEIPEFNWQSKTQINEFKALMDSYTFDRLKGWLYDLKEDTKKGYINNPPGVFLYWLKTDMGTKELKEQNISSNQIEVYKPHQDIEQIQKEFSLNNEPDIATIELPSRKNGVELPKILSDWPFFTLSTNKEKFDEISIKIKTEKGIILGILIRGSLEHGLKGYGILSAFEARIFNAIVSLWIKKKCNLNKEKDNKHDTPFLIASVRFTLKELFDELGMTHTGPNAKIIKNALINLHSKPYSLYIPDMQKSYGFFMLGRLSITNIKKGRQTENTGISLSFSPEITSQFYNRHSLPFSKDILKLKSELAYLLWLYLEPIIAKIKKPDKKPLLQLIQDLHLPPNKMYYYKSQRKQVFDIAIKNLSGIKTAKGKEVKFQWEEDINDWNLIFGLDEYFPKKLST